MTLVALKANSVPAKLTPRMTLGNIRRGRLDAAIRALIYGVEGVGKSTFAMHAPAPIFLCKDNGTEELDVARFPEPRDWTEALEAIQYLTANETPYKTLVVDAVNWLEPLCWAKVCRDKGWADIEEPGYGKGYDAALDEWRVFVAHLERLWETRKFNIVLVAHAQVKSFSDPEATDSFDRYTLAMNQKAAGLLKQWCSAVLFARHELHTFKEKGSKRVRGISSGTRNLYTEWSAAYDAKNRYNLPASLPLSWDEFAAAVDAGRSTEPARVGARATEYRARIEALVAELGDVAYAARAKEIVEGVGDDVGRLAVIENRVAARVAAAAAAEPREDTKAVHNEGGK